MQQLKNNENIFILMFHITTLTFRKILLYKIRWGQFFVVTPSGGFISLQNIFLGNCQQDLMYFEFGMRIPYSKYNKVVEILYHQISDIRMASYYTTNSHSTISLSQNLIFWLAVLSTVSQDTIFPKILGRGKMAVGLRTNPLGSLLLDEYEFAECIVKGGKSVFPRT